jgi:hypothetical protein
LRIFAPHIPKFLLSESANFNFIRILGEGKAHSDGFDPTVLIMGGYQWLLFTLSDAARSNFADLRVSIRGTPLPHDRVQSLCLEPSRPGTFVAHIGDWKEATNGRAGQLFQCLGMFAVIIAGSSQPTERG